MDILEIIEREGLIYLCVYMLSQGIKELSQCILLVGFVWKGFHQ